VAALMLASNAVPFAAADRLVYADFEKVDFRPEVRPLILRENAIRLFGLKETAA